MTAAELAKILLEHPDWDVEIQGTSWGYGSDEPERYASTPDVDELEKQKKFLIYAT